MGIAPQAMAIVRALLRSPVRDLTSCLRRPEVGCCAGRKVRRVVYSFVSLDSIALEPHFRNARQSGAVQANRAR